MNDRFFFWQPPAGYSIKTGPEQIEVALPGLPMPLQAELDGEAPSDLQLGEGLYAYLRQFPDCDNGSAYAFVLKDVFPHYIADLASQAVMLDHKAVDSPYLLRQVNCLKILALLEPDNAALPAQLGIACYQLALMFQELPHSRHHLLQALGYLNKAHSLEAQSCGITNYLAHVNYLIGDYPVALEKWREALVHVDEEPLRQQLEKRIQRLQDWEVPHYPLSDDLELVGQALVFYGEQKFGPALQLLEQVSSRELLLEEFSMPEFHYLVGLCCLGLEDTHKAGAAFRKALAVDPDYSPARDKLSTIS